MRCEKVLKELAFAKCAFSFCFPPQCLKKDFVVDCKILSVQMSTNSYRFVNQIWSQILVITDLAAVQLVQFLVDKFKKDFRPNNKFCYKVKQRNLHLIFVHFKRLSQNGLLFNLIIKMVASQINHSTQHDNIVYLLNTKYK